MGKPGREPRHCVWLRAAVAFSRGVRGTDVVQGYASVPNKYWRTLARAAVSPPTHCNSACGCGAGAASKPSSVTHDGNWSAFSHRAPGAVLQRRRWKWPPRATLSMEDVLVARV
eukprot:CAMPEP_0117610584 /NCGR_PEP_ID=MMETSP0784-20121206/81946_1 /TAXON_ID=39447 /ORGANISM="" /LENGTH=113 /DNA_ID=CAMNT_0005413987 /DNA_START=614 /DNA_END=956 /DNA_ORIENTATION=+